MRSLRELYEAYDRVERARLEALQKKNRRHKAILRHMGLTGETEDASSGFARIRRCNEALEALDRRGWNRSFHQREFHDHFTRACARIFWKTEAPGQFARDHQKILECHGWDSLRQEILISTPRRFGKTISVSMFAAAMLFAAPNLEMSIYSTCKRISQKLLRNVYKFLGLIYDELKCPRMPVLRLNFEEVVLQVRKFSGGSGSHTRLTLRYHRGRTGSRTSAWSTRIHRR